MKKCILSMSMMLAAIVCLTGCETNTRRTTTTTQDPNRPATTTTTETNAGRTTNGPDATRQY